MFWIVVLVIWWILGMAGFYYCWLETEDLTVTALTIGIFVGFIGPLSFPLGWAINHSDYVILKRRGK
jgi:hypothetical protein